MEVKTNQYRRCNIKTTNQCIWLIFFFLHLLVFKIYNLLFLGHHSAINILFTETEEM